MLNVLLICIILKWQNHPLNSISTVSTGIEYYKQIQSNLTVSYII